LDNKIFDPAVFFMIEVAERTCVQNISDLVQA